MSTTRVHAGAIDQERQRPSNPIGLSGLLGFMLFLAGCAGGMVKVDGPVSRNTNEATIVFMRSSFVGAAVAGSVFDVTQKEAKFIGIIANGTKIAYPVAPGEHIFMVVGESADFMKATVVANKIYYALVTPRPGIGTPRFSFRPLRQSDLTSEDFVKWDSNTQLVQASAEANAWAQENAADINAKREMYWQKWQAKEQFQRDSQTLNPDDGR